MGNEKIITYLNISFYFYHWQLDSKLKPAVFIVVININRWSWEKINMIICFVNNEAHHMFTLDN